MEQNSEHPLAEAIMEKVKANQIELLKVEAFESISGRGVKAKIEGRTYFGGNIAFMKENGISVTQLESKIQAFLEQGKTVLYFANQETIIGAIAVADTIKQSSFEAIQQLKEKAIEVVMLTGDNHVVASTIGEKLGIDKVVSEVLPQDKAKEVEKLQEQGKKVAFVGDGINDSPALVQADIGLAIGSGTDIAIDSADIVLMKNNLQDVVTAIDLSKAVIGNIKMNLFWAFFYNCIGIPIAAGVFYLSFALTLNPMIGAAAMSLSSVCVVTNALRLRKFKPQFPTYDTTCPIQQSVEAEFQSCQLPQKQNIVEVGFDQPKKEEKIMKKIIQIEGMQCNHCKMTVEKALGGIDGVTKVEVDLENKNAILEMTKEIADEKIKEAIEQAGFEAK